VNIHNEVAPVARNIKEIYDADIAANIEGWTAAWFSAYGDATIASLPSAAWMEGTLRAELPDTAGDWGVFKIPALESGGPRASNWGGSNLAIADQVSDEEKARGWDYMEYSLATEEMQLAMYDEYGLFRRWRPSTTSRCSTRSSTSTTDRLRGRSLPRSHRSRRDTGSLRTPRGVTGHRDRTAANDQR